MRYLLFLFILSLQLGLSAQNDCLHYAKYIGIGDLELKKGSDADFEKVINNYSIAMLHCPEKAEEARAKILEAFEAIEGLKILAEKAKQEAQTALTEVNQEQAKTKLALAKTKEAEAIAQAALDSANQLNKVISSNNTALKSLSSENLREKVDLAIEAFRSLPDTTGNMLAAPIVLQALHEALTYSRQSNNYPTKGKPLAVRMVKQENDTSAWIIDQKGKLIRSLLNENGIYKKETIVDLDPMYVYDFAFNSIDSSYVFGGVYTGGKQQLLYYQSKSGLVKIDLPDKIKFTTAMAFNQNNLIIAASDSTIQSVSISNGSSKYEELFSIDQKITALEVTESALYIGTDKGEIIGRDFESTQFDTVNKSDGIRVSKLKKTTLKNQEDIIVAGYVNGSTRIFRKSSSPENLSSQHRDYITQLASPDNNNLLAKMSLDGRMSLTEIKTQQTEDPTTDGSIVLRYSENQLKGICVSRRYNCIYIFLADGSVDVLHLNPAYYLKELDR